MPATATVRFRFWDVLDRRFPMCCPQKERRRAMVIASTFGVRTATIARAFGLSRGTADGLLRDAWTQMSMRQVRYHRCYPEPSWHRRATGRGAGRLRHRCDCGHRIAPGELYVRIGSQYVCGGCWVDRWPLGDEDDCSVMDEHA